MLAVKIVLASGGGISRLCILHEKRPAVTLRDILEDCDYLKEARATVCLVLLLNAQEINLVLQGIHNPSPFRPQRCPHRESDTPRHRSLFYRSYRSLYHMPNRLWPTGTTETCQIIPRCLLRSAPGYEPLRAVLTQIVCPGFAHT